MSDVASLIAAANATKQKGRVGLKSASSASDGAPAYTKRNPPVRPTAATWKRKSTTVSVPSRSAIKTMAVKDGYANSVTNLIDYSASRCKEVFKQIQDACVATGKPYFDDTFFFGDRNAMYPDGTPADCTVTEPQAVERLSVLFPNVPVFAQTTDSLDIDQGAMGDCFFIGAAAALASCSAQHLNPVGRLFVASDVANGIYGLVFYKDGGWEWVIIDDLVAVDPQSRAPLYACATGNAELWPMLLEKAYAKMHYCWDTIDGGWEREALADMTGGKEYTINLYNGPDKDMTFDQFKVLVDNVHTVLGCAVGKQVQNSNATGHAGEEGAVFGLFKGHAYSVLQAVKCSDGAGFVRVRNPWGNDAEWKGPYCDRDKMWDKHPVHFNEVKPNFANDGAFWMKWDDFRQYFTDIDVCEYFDPTWNCVCLFGKSNRDPLCANQTYLLELSNIDGSSKDIEVVLTLGQEDPKAQSDHGKAKNCAYATLRLAVYALTGKPDSFAHLKNFLGNKIETRQLYNRQVDEHIKLPPGRYSLCPKVTDAPAGTGYNIRVLAPSTAAICIQRFDDPVNTTRQIGFQGVPSELAEDAAFVKAQQSRSFKGKNLKASTGVEDGAPEYVLRNPRLQPTAATIKRKSTTVTTATRSTIKPLAQKASYGATVSAIYDVAVQACKAAVDAVVAACKTAGDKPFFDQSFHYGDRNSLYPDGTPADCTVTEPQAVERLSVLYPNAPLFGAAVDSLDIDQGSMGDCFFIGATSALASSTAQHLNPVGRLFAASDLKYGVYGLVFYKNGGWEWVIIDDFIAVDPQSKEPLYASATNNAELWPIVLEKAYAKLHYCWDTIDGGWEREALADMTGGKEYSINLLDDHKDMTFDEFKSYVDNIHTVMGCAVNKNAQDSNAVGHAGEAGAVFGLFKGHAYSVLQATKCSDGAGFVRVRNPWGNDAEWKGPYCDRDKAWEDNPLHKREVKPNFANDGAFWMKWEDFRQYFCDIDVCEYTDFTWNTLTFFGSSNVPATCANQTYIMELRHASGSDDPVDVILTMGQEDPKSQPDHAKAKNSAYGYIKLSCYQLTNVPTSYSQMSSCLGTKIETKKVYNRGVDNHIKLSPGKYSLVPTIDRAPAKTGYYVRVFAPSDVTISMYRFDSPSDVVSAKGVLAANAGTTPAAAPAAATPAPSAAAATPAAAAPAPTPTPPTVVVAGPAGAAFRGGGAAVITPAAAPAPAAPVIPSIVTNANADGGLTFHRTPGGFAAAVATGFSVADPVGRGSVDSNGAMIALGQLFLRSDIATAFAKAVHDAGTVDKATFQRLLERAMEDHGL